MFKVLSFAGLIGLSVAGYAQATTVFSDDFEDDALGLNSSLLNWTVTSGSIDTIGAGFYGFYGPGKYIDLNGSTGRAGRIETGKMRFTVGQQYELSFDVGNNKYSNGNEVLSFGVGSARGRIGINGYIDNFIHYSFRFTATQSLAKIFFADTGRTPGDNGGPILDNVMVASVPVPAAAPLLLGAIGALTAIRRRRRKA